MKDSQEKMHSMISSVALAAAKNDALAAYDKAVIKYNFSMVRSAEDALNNNSPSLATLKKKMALAGKVSIVSDVLEMMVAKTARAFNVPRDKQIEVAQIKTLVEDLQTECYFLKLSEVYFVLREARLGRQGKIYERIDQPTIMTWFDEYIEKRFQMAIDKTLREHDMHTASEKSRTYDGYIEKLHSQQASQRSKEVKGIAYAMAQKMTNKAINDFNQKQWQNTGQGQEPSADENQEL